MAPSYASWKKILLLCYFQAACCLAFLGWIPQKFHPGQEVVDEATKERVIQDCITTFPFPKAKHDTFKVKRAPHSDYDQEKEDNYLQKILDELDEMDETYQMNNRERFFATRELLGIMNQMNEMDEDQRYYFMIRSRNFHSFSFPPDKHSALKIFGALYKKIKMRLTPPTEIEYNQHREDLHKIMKEVDQLNKDFVARSGDIPRENSEKITQTLGALNELHQTLSDTIGKWVDTLHYDIMSRRGKKIENLSNLLHGLVLPQNQGKISSFEYLEEISLKLQRIVFQTVDWMVNHGFWEKVSFRNFYRKKDTIQLAAINLVRTFNLKYKQTGLYPIFPRSAYILGDNYSSHFKSISTVLSEAENREFAYSSMKAVFTYCYSEEMKEMENLSDLIFSHDNQVFHELEQSLKTRKTISNQNLVKGDRNLRESLKIIADDFQYESFYERNFNRRITMEFIYINFIQLSYGKDLISMENLPYPQFENRFKALSSSIIFIEELDNLKLFLHDLVSQDKNIPRMNSVMINIHKIKLRQNLSLARDYFVQISRNHFDCISDYTIRKDYLIKYYIHLDIVKEKMGSLIELMQSIESKTGDYSPQFLLKLANDVNLDKFDKFDYHIC